MNKLKKLKVLHFFWSGEAGGRENLVYQLIKEQLKDDELNVSLLLGERKGYYIKLIEDLGVQVYYLPSNKEFAPKNYKYILSLLRQFDIIHIHGVNLLVIIAVILTKSKSIFTFHGKRNFISKNILTKLTRKT